MIQGIVEQGKQLGRTIGFPTANIRVTDADGCLPENGVYAAALWIEGDDRAYPGMLNQGSHPTAPEGKPTIEIHLFDFDGDIYGLRIRLEYLHYLRPEKRFESLAALKDQLEADRNNARNWIRENAGQLRRHGVLNP